MARRFPHLAREYYVYRFASALRRHPSRPTPHGFQFRGNELMQNGQFEPGETALLRRCASQVDVYVDVGANIGFFVCLMRSLGKRVVAVEPLQQNIDYLFANLEANGWSDVEVLPLGAGREPGIVQLYGGGTGASLVEHWAGASGSLRSTIPVNSLDNLLAGRFSGDRLLIKIDVEGAELGALQGAVGLLTRLPRPQWLIEICLTENHPLGVNPHYVAVFDLMFAHGYRAYSVEADLREVRRQDVAKWFATRVRDFGYVSFYFDAKQ